MKLETFKTIILFGLIGLSLILSFSLWSYQTNYSGSHNPDPSYVPEVDAGGDVQTKRDVIVPKESIIHTGQSHYGFEHPEHLMDLYKDIQHWTLTEYVAKEEQDYDFDEPYMEMVYPEAFPIEVIKNLFTLADDIDLPNWNFERMLFSLEEEQNAVSIFFLSVDERNYIRFTVYDQSAYTAVSDLLENKEHLVEYMVYNEDHKPFYVPVDTTEVRNRTLAVDTIDPRIFVDALFQNPSLVATPNFGESYFIDGQRDMRVTDDGAGLEFINPLQNTPDRMNSMELIEESLAEVNDHNGWTADYHLAAIDKTVNRIVYQMYYDDYPVFHDQGRTSIEQQWRNQQLYKYNRPLFIFESPLGGDYTELPSGYEVIYFLENIDKYHVEKVSDVQIGYRVADLDVTSYSIITLEPAWYMLYNGKWQRIDFDELDEQHKGGA